MNGLIVLLYVVMDEIYGSLVFEVEAVCVCVGRVGVLCVLSDELSIM